MIKQPWRDRGLTKEGAREADKAMPAMLEAVRLSMTADVAKQVASRVEEFYA